MPYYNAEFYRDATFHDNIEVDGTVEADKVGSANNPNEEVVTNKLTDGTDSQAWETLREMGYETGDVVPTFSFGPSEVRAVTTSSATYSNEFGLMSVHKPPAPSGVTTDLKIGLSARLAPGTDEEVFARVVNFGGDGSLSQTEISATAEGRVWSGWQDWDPTNPTEVLQFIIAAKSDPGTNSSEVDAPSLVFGVEI